MRTHSHDQQQQRKFSCLSELRSDSSTHGDATEKASEHFTVLKKTKTGKKLPISRYSVETSESPSSQHDTKLKLPEGTSFHRLLLDLWLRTLKYSLLPEVTAMATAVGPNREAPGWEVTIALDELGISVSGQGSTRLLAEVAASIQFELMLSSPETLAKLETFPRAEISLNNAPGTILAYCKLMSMHVSELRTHVRETESDAFEARIFSEERQIGKGVTSASKPLVKDISPLVLTHSIVKGHPEVWPAGIENPFHARISVDPARMEWLHHFIRSAKHHLRSKAGVCPRNGEPAASSVSQDATVRQSPDLDSLLATLPLPRQTAKMLILAASMRSFEPAIILAALGKHDVYRRQENGYDLQGIPTLHNPHLKHTLYGDHSDIALMYQRFRRESQKKPESGQKAAAIFSVFDPSGIRSVNAAARDIERIMRAAGLLRSPEDDSNVHCDGVELEVRSQMYGGDLNMNSSKMATIRHLMVLGFGHNIAQYGYNTLLSGAQRELRVGSQQVHLGTPYTAPMKIKQLQMNLKKGPLFVLSGTSELPEGRGLRAQYSSPIATWQAVLFAEDVSTAEEAGIAPQPGASQLIINGWLPVFVKSEIPGVAAIHVRKKILEAREILHRAMDKAMKDYIVHRWSSAEFYKLLRDIPIDADGVSEAKDRNGAKSEKVVEDKMVVKDEDIVEGNIVEENTAENTAEVDNTEENITEEENTAKENIAKENIAKDESQDTTTG